jgi:hypothetical protein
MSYGGNKSSGLGWEVSPKVVIEHFASKKTNMG